MEVIGFDGQTIYQEPPVQHLMRNYDDGVDLVSRWLDGPYPCGLQIGEPAIVAEACETAVVTHFRPMDHALGGTGARETCAAQRTGMSHFENLATEACVLTVDLSWLKS